MIWTEETIKSLTQHSKEPCPASESETIHSNASTDVYDRLVELWEQAKLSIRSTSPSVAEDLQNGVVALMVGGGGEGVNWSEQRC